MSHARELEDIADDIRDIKPRGADVEVRGVRETLVARFKQ